MKHILKQLLNGKVSRVKSHWIQQLAIKQNTEATAKEWKAALPHMFVWFDFMSVPQMGARGTAADTADQAGLPVSSCIIGCVEFSFHCIVGYVEVLDKDVFVRPGGEDVFNKQVQRI